MATTKQLKKKASGGSKGRVKPNVAKAGFKPGHRYCGGGKKSN